MKNIYIDDQNFKSSREYQEFIKNNPGIGFLDVRVYAASGAIPVSNLKVSVSTIIGDNNVIFFEGYSDSSGIIKTIELPAPKLETNDLNIPTSLTYNILATYVPDNVNENFKVEIFDNIRVIQNISVLPKNMGEY